MARNRSDGGDISASNTRNLTVGGVVATQRDWHERLRDLREPKVALPETEVKGNRYTCIF